VQPGCTSQYYRVGQTCISICGTIPNANVKVFQRFLLYSNQELIFKESRLSQAVLVFIITFYRGSCEFLLVHLAKEFDSGQKEKQTYFLTIISDSLIGNQVFLTAFSAYHGECQL
jgi:hypothetical protein